LEVEVGEVSWGVKVADEPFAVEEDWEEEEGNGGATKEGTYNCVLIGYVELGIPDGRTL
jgi:hypothetical protein